jgi:hypothetical protein
VEELRGENWDAFPARRNDWSRALFLWGVRRRCGFTLREVGEAAGGMAPAAVDMAIRRLDQRARHTPKLAALQRKLLESLDADVLAVNR